MRENKAGELARDSGDPRARRDAGGAAAAPASAAGPCCHRFRYVILLLGFLCLTSVQSNMVALNFSLICMSPLNNFTVGFGRVHFGHTVESA